MIDQLAVPVHMMQGPEDCDSSWSSDSDDLSVDQPVDGWHGGQFRVLVPPDMPPAQRLEAAEAALLEQGFRAEGGVALELVQQLAEVRGHRTMEGALRRL